MEDDLLKSNAKSFWQLIISKKNICIVSILWILVLLENIYFYRQAVHTIYFVDMFKLSDMYIALSILAPAVLWLFSTNVDFWNFHTTKFRLLLFVYINTLFRLCTIIYNLFYTLFMPFVLGLEPTKHLTLDLIVLLARLMIQAPSLIVFIYLSLSIKNFFNEYIKRDIAEFKLKHYIEPKTDKFEYNFDVAKDMETGKSVAVSQSDRETHVSVTGATGTGKTSSVFSKAINNDTYHKVLNENEQKKELVKMLKAGKVKMLAPMNDNEFAVSNFAVTDEKYLEEYKKKVLKYYSAGLTVVAPDNSLLKDVVKFCDKKGFAYKRVDPKRINGKLCDNFYGLNPLYMPDNLTDYEFENMVSKKYNIVADVMKALNEMDGKGDPYFNAVNREVVTVLSELLLRTYKDKKGKHPTLLDLQTLMNNFDEIIPFYEHLQKKYPSAEECTALKTNLQFLLGDSREKMEDHSKGVKVLLNNFLNDINIRTVMSAEKTVDFDKALRDGEIVLVNFELGELGSVNSPALGLFFILMYIDAVLRREGERGVYKVPNFFFVDEFPVVASPQFESCFTLFRKFGVSVHIALQTFGQFEKNDFLRYMKDVVLTNCNTHIIFGRAGREDMFIFGELDGEQYKKEEQIGVTQTSITTDNPTYSEQKRATMERDARTSGTDVRYKDFLEGTMYRTVKGHVEHARHIKMSFVNSWEMRLVKKVKVDWNEFYISEEVKEETIKKEIKEEILESSISVELPKKIVNVVEEGTEEKTEKETKEKTVSAIKVRGITKEVTIEDLIGDIKSSDEKRKEEKKVEEKTDEKEDFDLGF